MYYVYIDKTDDGIVYYVGKGSSKRTKGIKRNTHHSNIVNKYGVNREIVFETDYEQEAFNKEIELIKYYHTYHYDELANKSLASNYTIGGDGASGKVTSDETKKILSIARTGKKQPDEAKQKVSKANAGRVRTDEFKQKVSENNGMKRPEVKAKISGDLSASKRPEVRAKISEKMKGDNNPAAKFGPEIREKIFELRKLNFGYTKISEKLKEENIEISRAQIRNIIKKYLGE